MSIDQVHITLIDFSPNYQTNIYHQKLTEKFRYLPIHRKKIVEQVEIFRKFRRINPELSNDEEYCLKVVQMEGTVLRKLKYQNWKIAFEAAKQNGNCYVYLRKQFKQNLEILEQVTNSSCSERVIYQLIKDFDQSDKIPFEEIIILEKKVLKSSNIIPLLNLDITKYLLNDRNFMLELISQCVYSIPPVFYKNFNKDRDFILQIFKISKCPIGKSLIQGLSWELREDLEIILEIVTRHGSSLSHVPRSLLKNRQVVLEAVKQDWRALEWAISPHNSDLEIVTLALKQDRRAFQYVDETARESLPFVKKCLEINGEVIMELRDNCPLEIFFFFTHLRK